MGLPKLAKIDPTPGIASVAPLPVSVIVPVRNEAHNLARCLEALRDVGEVYVVDSQSTDSTAEIARSYGARVVQFHYQGGWPKKRQWAIDTLPLVYDWVLLVDADETLTPELAEEIRTALRNPDRHGYHIGLQMYFLGRKLRHCGANFYKLSLFRRGRGRYECRLKEQDASMCDMEVHEHVVVNGETAKLRHPFLHYNVESLSRYIQKHDEYSNWEAQVWLNPNASFQELRPSLFGSQAQRRRWLKKQLYFAPGSPVLLFFYQYLFRFGFLDGVPGLIYCTFQAIQMFQVKAKIVEARRLRKARPSGDEGVVVLESNSLKEESNAPAER